MLYVRFPSHVPRLCKYATFCPSARCATGLYRACSRRAWGLLAGRFGAGLSGSAEVPCKLVFDMIHRQVGNHTFRQVLGFITSTLVWYSNQRSFLHAVVGSSGEQ